MPDTERAGARAEAAAAKAGRAASKAAKAAARGGRRARYEALFAPGPLAAAGAAISLAFLFQPSLAARGAMLALFMTAALASGKRVSIPATLLVSAGIVAANLLVPVGRVIARIGPLRITETALLEGIEKAVTFEGLVYISKSSILPSLRIPGRFGSIVASAFLYYDRILEYKGRLRPASLIADADELMLRVWEGSPAGKAPEARVARPIAGALALGLAVAAAYAALAIGLTAR
jgi:hypothetical protein